jgi:hypothetical protein
MIGLQSNKVIKLKEKEVPPMATYKYDIPTLLEGKYYRSLSRHDEGTIVYATPRKEIWYGENTEAYAIEVRPTRGIKNFWATVAVKVGE